MIEKILAEKSVLIVGHVRPDGDCIGAGLTLRHLLTSRGAKADFVCDSPPPAHFKFLPDFEFMNNQLCNKYTAVVTVDCADHLRMGKYVTYLNKVNNSYNIDHHFTNNRFAKFNHVVRDASSTCEILFDLLKPLRLINDKIATLLFCGISTDTGHFMHNNTGVKVMKTATELIETGINVNEITNLLYKSNTKQKTKLTARAINSMRFFADEKICVISIFNSDLQETDCTFEDTEGLIDYAIGIDTVEVALCVTEQKPTLFKVSYRSKKTDVASAAAVFGGGGHKLAAGCSVCGEYEDVISKLIKSVLDGM